MCGIAGYVDPAGADHSSLAKMTQALFHRGPDDDGLLIDGSVGLGHRRLSIIDLASGQQPMSISDGAVSIVFNGEIYNYRELRKKLEPRYHFKTNSDTEVLLRIYEEMGESCISKLRGMFSFAILDRRKNCLVIGRDHLGQKPLYYWHDGEHFAFASEIKAILALKPELRQLNPQALYEYLTIRIITPPRSMFKEIRKLPPAHCLVFQDGKVDIRRYWQLDYRDKLTGSLAEVTGQLDEQLRESVRYHLVSDVPVGAYLSGGVDSGLIVAMMANQTDEPFHTFTGDVPYKDFSELPYAKLVDDRYKTNNHVLTFKPSLAQSLPELIWHMDEPSDSLTVAMYYISRLAREHVKVVLGGDGGDELFGGYDRYYGNVYASMYAWLPAVLRKQIVGRILDLIPEGAWYQSHAHQAKWINSIAFYQGAERYAKSLSYFYFSDRFRQALYTPAFLNTVGVFDPEVSIKEHFDQANADELIDKMLNSDSVVRMPDHPVMITDRMSMAHGLEARAPFLDHKLAEFCARIPVKMKVKGRQRRLIQMELAKRYLPPEVMQRKKQGFSSAITYMLADEYQLIYRTFLKRSRLVEENILNAEIIDKLLEDHLAKRSDHGQRLWLLSSAEVWYRMYIDGVGKEGIVEMLHQGTASRAA